MKVSGFQDLHTLCETFDENNNFKQCQFFNFDDDDTAYMGQVTTRKYELTAESINEAFGRISDEDIYPKAPAGITIVSPPWKKEFFIKRPCMTYYSQDADLGLLPKLILGEVETLELLKQHPHPNLVRYHGCTVNRGRITGIVLDKYPLTLQERMQAGTQGFDKDSCMESITSAVAHLHSLGLAHNDLNPVNVMIDQHEAPIIIDFGSGKPFGTELDEKGTSGWTDEEFCTSEQHHDEVALRKIRAWMDDPKELYEVWKKHLERLIYKHMYILKTE